MKWYQVAWGCVHRRAFANRSGSFVFIKAGSTLDCSTSIKENCTSGTTRPIAPNDVTADVLYYERRFLQLNKLAGTQSLSVLIQWSLFFSYCLIETLFAFFVFPIRVSSLRPFGNS